MTSETYLNASQAAERTGKSVVTIRHYLATKQLPNASQVAKGKVKVWRIPLTDLIASGLLVDRVSIDTKAPSQPELAQGRTDALETQIDQLETALRHSQELLARTEQELESYRQRERQLFMAIETRDTQDRRRFSWFRRS
jgi:DNA-binding transcriptional MerR regulator